MSNLVNVINLLKQNGMPLDVVYDFGAHKGHWTSAMKKFLPAEYYMFEANLAHEDELKQVGDNYFCGKAFSDGRESVKFYKTITGSGTGDSYYEENTKWYEGVYTELEATTVDKCVSENNLPQPQFIKLDTQGSELDVLAGATKTLQNTHLILTELPLLPYNKGAPSTDDYINNLKDLGFVPLVLTEQHHIDSILVQIDMLFIKLQSKDEYLEKTVNLNV